MNKSNDRSTKGANAVGETFAASSKTAKCTSKRKFGPRPPNEVSWTCSARYWGNPTKFVEY